MSFNMQRKTHRPNGWPKLLKDWVGMRLRSLKDHQNGKAILPAGTAYTVKMASRGLHLVSDPCPHCGVKIFINGCQADGFERIPEDEPARAVEPRAAECTRDPIWGVQERRILYRGSGYEYCSDCECWHPGGSEDCPEGEHNRLNELDLLDKVPDDCWELWEMRNGHLFLSRAEAESWARRFAYNLSWQGWRVFCFALPRESSLTALLNEHAPVNVKMGEGD